MKRKKKRELPCLNDSVFIKPVRRKRRKKSAKRTEFSLVNFRVFDHRWEVMTQTFSGGKKRPVKRWRVSRVFSEGGSAPLLAALKELALSGAQPTLRRYRTKKGLLS